MTHVAPRIVNNVSCVKRINDEWMSVTFRGRRSIW